MKCNPTTASLRRRFNRMIRRLADPDVELLAEEFVPVLVVFKRLEVRGVRFDPALAHLLRALERQIYDGADDSDSDHSDALLDPDDSDEDSASPALPLWRQIQADRQQIRSKAA